MITKTDCDLNLKNHFKDNKQSNKLIVNSTFSFYETSDYQETDCN